jgi:hypothetical protein
MDNDGLQRDCISRADGTKSVAHCESDEIVLVKMEIFNACQARRSTYLLLLLHARVFSLTRGI